MNERDDDVVELLSQARRALSPTPADEARVLARTLHAASLPVAPAAASSSGAKLAAALVIAGVSGSVGYMLGRQASQQENAQVVQVPPTPDWPVVTPAPIAEPEPPVIEPARKPIRTRPPARPLEAPAKAPVEAPVDPFAEVRGGATSSLEIEVRFMKAVERALRDHQPDVALRMLDRLDEEVPHGSLDEERLAASVMARCKLGLGNRAKLVEELTSRYPASAYTRRVRDSCDRH